MLFLLRNSFFFHFELTCSLASLLPPNQLPELPASPLPGAKDGTEQTQAEGQSPHTRKAPDTPSTNDNHHHNNDDGGNDKSGDCGQVSAEGAPHPLAPFPPQPGDAGFDSGRGESSDGDSPQSPKIPAGGVGAQIPASDDQGKLSGNGGDAPASKSNSSKSSNNDNERSPRKGGHSRTANSTSASGNDKLVGSGCKMKPAKTGLNHVVAQAETGLNHVVTQAEINSQALHDNTNNNTETVRLHTVNELSPVRNEKDRARKSKLERRETNDSGVDVKARNSVVSSSEVSIHSATGGNLHERGRKVTLEGESLTPVTEV